MIYVDALKVLPGGIERCRLFGTDLAELREFAHLRLRISPLYEQTGPPTHYSLRPPQRKVALERGAKEIGEAELARRLTPRKETR